MAMFTESEIIDLMFECGYLANEEEKDEVMHSEVKLFKELAELAVRLKEKKDARI
ncbi:hypothetical protein LCGC14_1407180 [marine sediment metagenome]|uniref:Uncharacterized protein n=1 Tax=marine sediment metagenome TaxID=412755 RepID=A0A0F9JVR7_9ZZZZ